MPSIPPTNDPVTGQLVCPIGYTLNPSTVMCDPNSTAPVDMTDPTIRKLVLGLPDAAIDPHQAALLSAEGYKDSNIIERFIVALLEIPLKIIAPLVTLGASIVDDALAVLADAFLAAQGEHASGYYRLAGALMQDMLGIEIGEEELVNAFASGGRVNAMRALGGKVVDTLIGEFLGVKQADSGGVFAAPAGTGLGGLPDLPLSPEQGLAGLRAFVGFMTAFAIREGNTDMLASLIPHGFGDIFKDFAEDFTKNIGIGRLGRIAWKPIVTTTVAQPAQWAMNKQYRPTMFSSEEAMRDRMIHPQNEDKFRETMARHGYSVEIQDSLYLQKGKKPSYAMLRDLLIRGDIDADVRGVYLHAEGFTDEAIGFMDAAMDYAPLRSVILREAEHLLGQYLRGRISGDDYRLLISGMSKTTLGRKILSDGEVQNLTDVPPIASSVRFKHLSVSQNMRLYLDGIVSLQEFEAALLALGYDQATVTEETQEVLLMQKRQSDKAARAAASAIRGPLWHLSVAQLETGLAQGLVKDADLRAELSARHYTPAAINALVAEMYAKAKITPPTAPTT